MCGTCGGRPKPKYAASFNGKPLDLLQQLAYYQTFNRQLASVNYKAASRNHNLATVGRMETAATGSFSS